MADKNMNAKINVDFEESTSRQSLNSGDSLPTLFGKIKKFFSDLKSVAFSGSYNDLSDKPTSLPASNVTDIYSATGTAPVSGKAVASAISNKVDKISGKGLSTNDLTNALKSNYDVAYTHSQSDHAPSSAQANVIETIKVNNTALTPTSKTVNIYATNIPFIVGTQTAATGTWTGTTSEISSLVDGQTIRYWLPYNGSGNATLNLTLAGGTTTGAIACYWKGTSRLKTHYAAGTIITLTYRKAVPIGGSGSYTGWWADADCDYDTYYRIRYQQPIKCGTTAITAGNIIVGASGVYTHLKAGTAFDVTYPILYAASDIAASATNGTNNYLVVPFTVTTTQSITLTAYKPVFIKGSLSGTTFTPFSTAPLTQTVPTSADGYEYILLGVAYNTTAVYLLADHPIFAYKGGAFGQISSKGITDLSVSGQTITYTRGDGSTGTIKTQDTDTKVTSVGNHYTPVKSTTKSASGGTLTDITDSTSGTQVVTGVEMDAKGHVTGVTSVALKSTDTKVTVDSVLSSTSTNPVQNKVINSALEGKAAASHSHTVSEISDFPASLPANGGNADSVDGFHASSLFCQRTTPSSKDCNDCTEVGVYFFNGCLANAPTSDGVLNSGTYFILESVMHNAAVIQTATFTHGAYTGKKFSRYLDMTTNIWSAWGEIMKNQYATGLISGLSNGSAVTVSLKFAPVAVLFFDSTYIKPVSSGFSVSLGTGTFTITPSSVSAMGTTGVRYLAFGG